MGKPPLSAKPRKRAFSVGPANLPDGTYKRKVDKIKKSLIHKAKVKKSFAKTIPGDALDADPHAIRAKRLLEEAAAERERAKAAEPKDDEDGNAVIATTEIHPERRAALDQPEAACVEEGPKNMGTGAWKKRERRKKKTSAFLKEEREAARLREERKEEERRIEARKAAMGKSKKERALRKKVMSARTAKGQQKLGRQSALLLEKVKAQVGV